MTTFTVYSVSLGPGDPDLITLKALKVLRDADLVYCPGTVSTSRAKEILLYHGLSPEKLKCYEVPMKADRQDALTAYFLTGKEISDMARQGLKVAFVSEGDGGFYSSQHYLAEAIEAEEDLCVAYTPGIPAFIAAGARAGLHIVKGDHGLLVLPKVSTKEEILGPIAVGQTVVLMKPSRSEVVIKEALNELPSEKRAYYLENVGVSGKEFVADHVSEILARPFPYFSLLILS